jgi:hypothetical protein
MADLFGLEWIFYTMGFLFLVSGMLASVLIILSRKTPRVSSIPPTGT